MDGSEQQTHKPTTKFDERKQFSGKKARHTYTTFLACLPNGKIIYLSPTYFGAQNDVAISKLKEQLLNFWGK